jgi:kumamolisin
LPEVVDVGGTTLSTDENGRWVAEEGWAEYPATQGTGGGVSNLFDRPDWQQGVPPPQDSGDTYGTVPDAASHRLTPDVAAVADPATGPFFYSHGGKPDTAGGTSISAPIWAALTALMNEYLTAHGGHAVSDLNPLLYQVAANGTQRSFHDVSIGGNAAFDSGTGFDLATGLGTPDTMNLVNGILALQKAGR